MTEYRRENKPTAVVVAVRQRTAGPAGMSSALDELERLLDTRGIDTQERFSVEVREISPRFMIGSGKADEISGCAKSRGVDYIVFDDDLSPSQQRNWERKSGIFTIDRRQVILDIFGQRATTREARLQVELAQMEYQLPRLTRAWTHLSRQKGGMRGTRGEGEKQIEADRRMITERITKLRRELALVEKQRATRRKQRKSNSVPSGSIVGYTNAGKSSLLRVLTDADLLIEDKLFATLDPTSRRVALPESRETVLTDTVGFIRKLPHDLVDAFHSTLEEAILADFILHVVDAASPEAEELYRETKRVLAELGAGSKPVLTVLNKIDAATDETAVEMLEAVLGADGPVVRVSAKSGDGTAELLRQIQGLVQQLYPQRGYLIPYDRHDLVARLHRNGVIVRESYDNDGVRLVASAPAETHAAVSDYAISNGSSRNADHHILYD